MTIRALIVDDEPVARLGLRQRLTQEPDVEIVGECGDGASAIAAIGQLAPNVVFLDVQMPELGGFDVVEAVGSERMPAVVFVTAYDSYAVRAFDVHAIDYMLKPIDAERFRTALARARLHLHTRDGYSEKLHAALTQLGRTAPQRWTCRLAIKSVGRTTLVDVGDVDRFEAAGNYVEVHTCSKMHLLRETMANLEARLDPERFARISRSAIVAIGRVLELQPLFNGDFVAILKDGTPVTGSRRYRDALDRLLGELTPPVRTTSRRC
ncbi:LytTR family DNA-binding domain-containing protein [Tahibacter sp.]|uniref:LytR/AlgR family response regulator transcription factor n=1 Tax=Tahibacter sp. TaxID=2056211 RepID=UPI0028C50DDF|nr:LytTR family DNA-binding domain-containing protein [Tahibacter sp.]